MTIDIESMKRGLQEIAQLIEKNADPDPQQYAYFMKEPELAIPLVDLIDSLREDSVEETPDYYSACIFALEICVAQLQAAEEAGSKTALKTMNQLMACLTTAIDSGRHSLSFWLPILNAFYEVHVELSSELKDAYLDLAGHEDELTPEEEFAHVNTIREMIRELSDLSVFDIAENFFAQSHAMPADFFADLIIDLYSIEEGHDIGLLTLLHPKQEVRDVVVAMLDQLLPDIQLSSISLSRLQSIKNWYPPAYHDQFNRWIKHQRKKGVVFSGEIPDPVARIKASEVDGSGAQGIFVHLKRNRKNRLCGLLFKQETGIKDAWMTPILSSDEVWRYYDEAFDDSVTMREVDSSYFLMMTNHFLALTIEQGNIPNLHFLEIQETLGLHFRPQKLEVGQLIEQLGVQITPFTAETMQESLKRSKLWHKNKRFTESWFVESSKIDKLVNRCCNFIDSVKMCRFNEAIDLVLAQAMELERDKWTFHFLWVALWAKSKARKNEKIWQDSFMLAYAIHTGTPLRSLPIMHEICRQTVVNSIETMHERRTYLNKE